MTQIIQRPAAFQAWSGTQSGLVSMLALALCFSGCQESQTATPPKKDTGIINKATQDIGEAAPEDQRADMSAKNIAGAYGFAVSEVAKNSIKQAVEMHRATNGEYPKDHEEFMSKVIKQNGIKLPVLPGGRQYQYDVKNHELIVIEKEQTE